MSILRVFLILFRALFQDRSQLALENLALRQQLAILHGKASATRISRGGPGFSDDSLPDLEGVPSSASRDPARDPRPAASARIPVLLAMEVLHRVT
jgi:hypothetical protein